MHISFPLLFFFIPLANWWFKCKERSRKKVQYLWCETWNIAHNIRRKTTIIMASSQMLVLLLLLLSVLWGRWRHWYYDAFTLYFKRRLTPHITHSNLTPAIIIRYTVSISITTPKKQHIIQTAISACFFLATAHKTT